MNSAAAKPIDMSKHAFVVEHDEAETITALGSEITFICNEPGAWSLTRITSARGVGAPPHDHDFGEAYYVLTGSLALTIGGREVVLGAGDFIHIPGGTVHAFKATSDTPAQFMVLQWHGDADDFFRACARGGTRVPELAAQHGIRMAPSACSIASSRRDHSPLADGGVA
jgi:quercetin dioxygenase-like cupin family protein